MALSTQLQVYQGEMGGTVYQNPVKGKLFSTNSER